MAFQLIEISDLNYIIVKVSEEIQGQYLSAFIKTSLQEKDIVLGQSDKVFYTYLKQSSEYQISFYRPKSKKHKVFLEHIKPIDKAYNLYFSKNFLIIYHNNSLYYYQAIDATLSVKDIQVYAQERLNIKITNVQELDKNFFYKMESKGVENKLKYCAQNRFLPLQLYLFYLLLLGLCTLGYYYYVKENLSTIKLYKLQSQYHHLLKQNTFKKGVFLHTNKLYENINSLNLQLKNLEITQGVYTIKVISFEKNKLYDFLKFYEKESLHQNIEFDTTEKEYILHAKISFN